MTQLNMKNVRKHNDICDLSQVRLELAKNMQKHIQKGPWRFEKHVRWASGGFLEVSEWRLEPRLGSRRDLDRSLMILGCLWGFIVGAPGVFFCCFCSCCASGLG